MSGTAVFKHSITSGTGTDYPTSLSVPDITDRERDNEEPAQPTINRTEPGNGLVSVYWRAGDDRAESWQYWYLKENDTH